jgi:hypothetical protein
MRFLQLKDSAKNLRKLSQREYPEKILKFRFEMNNDVDWLLCFQREAIKEQDHCESNTLILSFDLPRLPS